MKIFERHLNEFNFSSAWCIGDVHGCAHEFGELIEKIVVDDYYSPIFQLGDLIDRGPYFSEVIDLISMYGIYQIIGNHEANFILESNNLKRCGSKPRQETHNKFNAYSESKQTYIRNTLFRSLTHAKINCDDKTFLLTHAPFDVKIDNLGNKAFSASKFCMCPKSYDEIDWEPNNNEYRIHAHQYWNYKPIEEQIKDNKRWLNIDGGCVYGNELIAVRIPDFKVIKVNANKQYCKE